MQTNKIGSSAKTIFVIIFIILFIAIGIIGFIFYKSPKKNLCSANTNYLQSVMLYVKACKENNSWFCGRSLQADCYNDETYRVFIEKNSQSYNLPLISKDELDAISNKIK